MSNDRQPVSTNIPRSPTTYGNNFGNTISSSSTSINHCFFASCYKLIYFISLMMSLNSLNPLQFQLLNLSRLNLPKPLATTLFPSVKQANRRNVQTAAVTPCFYVFIASKYASIPCTQSKSWHEISSHHAISNNSILFPLLAIQAIEAFKQQEQCQVSSVNS